VTSDKDKETLCTNSMKAYRERESLWHRGLGLSRRNILNTPSNTRIQVQLRSTDSLETNGTTFQSKRKRNTKISIIGKRTTWP